MKRINHLIIIAILSLGLIAAEPVGKARLTIINKSGFKLAIWLKGTKTCCQYYLTIPKGDKDAPYVEQFTIGNDKYTMLVNFVRIYDPVYPRHPCFTAINPEGTYTLDVSSRKTYRLTFPPCRYTNYRVTTDTFPLTVVIDGIEYKIWVNIPNIAKPNLGERTMRKYWVNAYRY